ncbi:hypothetical protein PRZ48_002454 [Zasmidium cellare]|uniref:PIPK domain-containing protein n=1 Tax=Zasmidium cellare TaxID=395010 RepID=A0ABR0F4T8_ZASCE|nr:hypothetical protein PRZ48_002454 [Zasmidium cellare]
MARRQKIIAHSVTYSILRSDQKRKSLLARIPSFFWIYWLNFDCVREDLFKALRETWQIDEEEYRKAFGADSKDAAGLKPIGTLQYHTTLLLASELIVYAGDMGYSGSTFFTTTNNTYLVKSIPRHFESSFFKNDLLLPYAEYMHDNPSSLLVRITDFLACNQWSLGTALSLAPTHHIIMENIKTGEGEGWETYDLKPMSYFYPERDVAGGVLTSEATKSKLADDFNEKISLSVDDAAEFTLQLQKDTAFLAAHNAVDYSLFLIRIPSSTSTPSPPTWRTGIPSSDGKWIYRAAILDFFWAKHKVHAKAMTGLIKAYNTVDRQGPMSVTTESGEYRERFLKMCTEMVETGRGE